MPRRPIYGTPMRVKSFSIRYSTFMTLERFKLLFEGNRSAAIRYAVEQYFAQAPVPTAMAVAATAFDASLADPLMEVIARETERRLRFQVEKIREEVRKAKKIVDEYVAKYGPEKARNYLRHISIEEHFKGGIAKTPLEEYVRKRRDTLGKEIAEQVRKLRYNIPEKVYFEIALQVRNAYFTCEMILDYLTGRAGWVVDDSAVTSEERAEA